MKQNHNIYFHRTSLQGFGCDDVVYQSEKRCISLDIALHILVKTINLVSQVAGNRE